MKKTTTTKIPVLFFLFVLVHSLNVFAQSTYILDYASESITNNVNDYTIAAGLTSPTNFTIDWGNGGELPGTYTNALVKVVPGAIIPVDRGTLGANDGWGFNAKSWGLQLTADNNFSVDALKLGRRSEGNSNRNDFTISGYKDGQLLVSQTLTWTVYGVSELEVFTRGTGSWDSNPAWNNIDKLVVSWPDPQENLTDYQEIAVINISVSDPVAANSTPTVTTLVTSSITATGATLNGNVTDDGGAMVTERGFVYGTNSNPTIGDGRSIRMPVGSGIGTYNKAINGLFATTTYYVRAYAINSEGTNYGSEKSFSTLSSPFENFSWSADNLAAGATGVTYTFSYTTVTAMSGAYDAILYALQSVNSGWNTENVSVEDVSVTIDGVKRVVSNVWTGSGSPSNSVFIRLTDPLVPAGSEVIVTIGNVINNSIVASYPWNWIRTATGGGNQIDEAASPDPIVLTAPTAKGAITITNAPSDPSSDWLLSEGKLIPLVDGAKVNVDVVNNALATGNLTIEAQTDVFIDAKVAPVLSADRTLTLKANRDINLEANSSIAANGFSLNTIIWSDADALEGGVTFIKNRAEILTDGGHLWIGGGSDSAIWNGLTVGNGTSTGNTTNSNGITLIKTNIQTDGGNIAFYGKGLPGFNAGIPTPISTGNSTNANGIRLHDGNLIDAGFGTIYMYGYANNQHPTSNSNGVELSQTVGAPDLITSSNNTEEAIFIEGHAEGPSTVANSWGFYSHLSTVENTGGGTVHIKGSAVKNSGVTVATNGAILAASGKIILEGTAAGMTSPSVLLQGVVGQKENTNVTLSDANIEIIGDRFSISGQAPNGRIQSSGKLAIHAYTNGIDIGLGSALATLQLPASYFISNFADGFSEILIGDANTGAININGKLLYQDPLTLKTNNNIVFNAQADVSSETANALKLWARAKGDNEANDANFGAIWMQQGSTIHTAGGNLTMGGGSDPYMGYAMGDPSVPSPENNAIYRGVAMNGSINAAGGHIIINGRGSSASSVGHARGVNIGGPIETTGSGNITIRGIGRGLSDAIALGDSYFFPNAVGTLKTETGNITIDGKPSSPNRNGLSISTSGSYIQTNGNFSATTNGRITATAGALDIGGSTYLEALDHITLTHENNDFDGSITVTSASNLQLADINELILGEISARGTIVIVSQNGDVTIAESISSTNATVDAIQIYADKDKNAGDLVGGNIKISGTPVISTGAGGQAKFYSGSILGSAGLIALIGEDNTRYNVDANTTIFDPVLGSGNYALIREKENLPPTATNVSFSGTLTTMQELTATYDYNDAENDLETGTTYQWYRADDSNGTGKLAIESANAITYTLSQEDIGKFISFEVTPKNAAGTGVPVESVFKGPIADVFSARISASINVSCNGGSEGSATVEIAGGVGPYSYNWNDPSRSTTSVVENLEAGTYVVTITDSRNQETTASVTITEPEVYTVEAPEDVVACGSYSLPVLIEGNYFTQPDGKGTALFAEDLITSSQTLYVYGENENGCTDEKSFDITINENDIAGIIFSDNEVVYNGEEHTLAVVGLPAGASVDYNVGNTYTNAGSYKVTATVTSAHSSCPNRILTATLTINKAEAVITAEAIQTFTYDGSVKNVSASLNHSEAELTYTEQQGYTNAGTYQVIISSEETANYLATSKEVSLVIEKAEITGVTFEGESFTYDGDAHSLSVAGLPEGGTVVYLNNGQTNAGIYTVTATVSQDNHNDKVLTATLTINKAEAVITAEAIQTFIYDGSMKNVSASLNHSEAELTYAEQQGYTNAGTYQVIISSEETANYQAASKEVSLVIEKAEIAGVTFEGDSFTYNGEAHSLSIAGIPEDATVVYSNNGQTNAGTYTVTASVSQDNHNDKVLTATLTINKAEAVITAEAIQTFIYDGSVKNVSASLNHSETELTYAAQQGYTNAGTYSVLISAEETANYLATSKEVSLVIEKAEIAGVTFEGDSFTYDGEAYSLSVAGLPEGATVVYSNNGQTNAGIYTVTASVSQDNHNDKVLTATLTINKAEAVITAEAIQTFAYDGSVKNVSASLNHSEAELTYAEQQGYTNAGTYQVIISSEETANYQAASKEVSLVIEKAEITGVTFEGDSFTYNGEAHSLSVVGLLEGATVVYSNNGQTNAGTYTVTASLSQDNHNDKVLTATLIINKAEAVITAEAIQTFTYDGSVKNVSASLNHSEAELTYAEQQGYTNAGTYQVIISSEETANYQAASKEVSLVIEKAEIAGVTFEGDSFTYNGEAHSLSVAGLPEDATVVYSNNGQTNAGTYTVTATVSQHGHKVLVLTANILIEKASQRITFDEIGNRHQLTDEDFQLSAASTSSLPIKYSYTYETENPAAAVGVHGFVKILRGGQIAITAAQPGNENYEAADPVIRTLKVIGGEARLKTAVINGVAYSNPTEDIYYLIGCGNSEEEVQIQLEQNQGSSIDRDKIFTLSTPVPGIYRDTVIVTSEDGNVSKRYNIMVEKNFNFEDIVIQKFNNVLLVNNNPNTNGGYQFVSYRWYKNGSEIGNGQYYSAGENEDDQLDTDNSYYVEMETENGNILKSCTSSIQLKGSLSLSLAPNPVQAGESMELFTDFPKSELETMQLSIHNLNGMLIKEMKSNSKRTNINLPYNLQMGIYILKVRTKSMSRTLKFIIK